MSEIKNISYLFGEGESVYFLETKNKIKVLFRDTNCSVVVAISGLCAGSFLKRERGKKEW